MTFIEEEDFERIIDYFDEKDDLVSAMDAAQSSTFHILRN